MVQLSHLYMTIGKTIALTIQTFVSKVKSPLFNTLLRFIIAFLPRSKRLLISWLQSPSVVISKWKVKISQSCPTLCNPMDCSLPGFSLRGILQARVLQWVAISFFRGSSQPRDQTWVSHIPGRRFNL